MTSCFKSPEVETDEPGSIIRPLNDIERFHAAEHAMHIFVSPMVGCRYTVPTSCGALQEVVEQAIGLTVLEHPLMRVGLAGFESRTPHWVRVANLDLQYHVQWHELNIVSAAPEAEAVTEVERVLRGVVEPAFYSVFDDLEKRPGWKVIVLRPRDEAPRWIELFITFNHTNFDGMSAKIFHESLLRNFRSVSSPSGPGKSSLPISGHVLALPNIPRSKMVPPQEKLVPFTVSPGFIASELWHEGRPELLKPAAAKRVRAAWAAPNTGAVPTAFSKTHWCAFRLDAATVDRAVAACRAHRATLTSLLQALVLASVCGRVDAARAPAFKSLTAITLRRFAKPAAAAAGLDPDRTMVNLVTTMPHVLDIDVVAKIRAAQSGAVAANAEKAAAAKTVELDQTIWNVASDVRAQIKARLDKGPKNEIAGAMKFIHDWRTYFKDEIKKPREPSWVVTNLGTIDPMPAPAAADGDPQDQWSIERALFTQGAAYAGVAFMVKIVSVKGRSTAVAITWEDGVVPDELMHGITEDLESHLRRIGASPDTKLS